MNMKKILRFIPQKKACEKHNTKIKNKTEKNIIYPPQGVFN